MVDDWVPENMPIMLMSRSLLTATKAVPYRIGNARATQQDEDSIIALDKMFEQHADKEEETMRLQGRYEPEGGTSWMDQLIDLPYQVSYYFPSQLRNPLYGAGRYGSEDLTFKALYEALCNAYNGGRRFIEDYFLSCFQDRMGNRYKEAVHALKQEIADEAQRRRAAHKAYLSNFDTWSAPRTMRVFRELAKETKRDIKASLETGQIPLLKNGLSESTLRWRKKLGIQSNEVFYATGRLIGSIQVSVILLDEQTAEKEGVN
jgi:hypothetical protein